MERQSITIKEKNYYIPDQSYLVDLIESYMGYDIAHIVDDELYKAKTQKEYDRLKFESDYASYEGTCEDNTAAFNEISNIIDDFRSKTEERKMISIQDVNKILGSIERIINNQI